MYGMTAVIKQFAAALWGHGFTTTLLDSQPLTKFRFSSPYFFCWHKSSCGGAESGEVT